MRQLLLLICCSPLLFSANSLLDQYHLTMAQYHTTQHSYAKALSHYRAIETPNDTVHYNLGNLLYRSKHYEEAISEYIQIDAPTLLHHKYHNIANTLMQTQDYERAIVFYQNALKFKPHPDTRSNLELAKQYYQAKQEKDKEKERKEAATQMALRDGSETINQFKEDNGTEQLKNAPVPTQIIKQHNSATTTQVREIEKISTTPKSENNLSKIADQTEQYRHALEQKWERLYQNRTLKTLLIPITIPTPTKGKRYDTNPY